MNKIPFAPHSQGWQETEAGCYCVLDGGAIDNPDGLAETLLAGASEYLGKQAELVNGFWAGDAICGKVLIVYFAPEATND